MSQITEQEKDIQSALLDMARAAGFTEKEFHTIQAALEKGATLADVFNISKDTLESGYAYAYNLYKAGNYKDAESMFRGLCMYDGDDPRYWMGLAGCLQARKPGSRPSIPTAWPVWPAASRIPRRSTMAACAI